MDILRQLQVVLPPLLQRAQDLKLALVPQAFQQHRQGLTRLLYPLAVRHQPGRQYPLEGNAGQDPLRQGEGRRGIHRHRSLRHLGEDLRRRRGDGVRRVLQQGVQGAPVRLQGVPPRRLVAFIERRPFRQPDLRRFQQKQQLPLGLFRQPGAGHQGKAVLLALQGVDLPVGVEQRREPRPEGPLLQLPHRCHQVRVLQKQLQDR